MASQGAPEDERSPARTDAEASGDLNRVRTSPRGLLKFRFLEEIRKRNVGRVAVLYLVVGWLILEPVHVVFHMLEAPLWANWLVIILLALGFPAALVFAWVYEITPEGLKPTVEVPHGQSIRKQTGRRYKPALAQNKTSMASSPARGEDCHDDHPSLHRLLPGLHPDRHRCRRLGQAGLQRKSPAGCCWGVSS